MNENPRDRLWTKRSRHGASLIDVAVGAAVLSLMLVPTMKMMGASATRIADVSLRDALLFEAERAIEMKKIELCDANAFDRSASFFDQEVSDNGADRFRIQFSLSPDPAIAELMTIVATAYQDLNGNRRLDSGEPQESLRTQWCRP